MVSCATVALRSHWALASAPMPLNVCSPGVKLSMHPPAGWQLLHAGPVPLQRAQVRQGGRALLRKQH